MQYHDIFTHSEVIRGNLLPHTCTVTEILFIYVSSLEWQLTVQFNASVPALHRWPLSLVGKASSRECGDWEALILYPGNDPTSPLCWLLPHPDGVHVRRLAKFSPWSPYIQQPGYKPL